MELKELALQYRESSDACLTRAMLLRERLQRVPAVGGDSIRLRRRIAILESMARDARATSKYLENYYRRPEYDGEKNKKNHISQGDGVPELEELRKAIRAAGKQTRRTHRRGSVPGTDPTSEANGDHVLS